MNEPLVILDLMDIIGATIFFTILLVIVLIFIFLIKEARK